MLTRCLDRILDANGPSLVRDHPVYGWIPGLCEGKLVNQWIYLLISVSLQVIWCTSHVADAQIRDIPLVISAFVLWKIYKRTTIVKLTEIPLKEALARAEQDIEPEPKQPGWRRWIGFLWD